MNVAINFLKLFLPNKIKERMAFTGADYTKIKQFFGENVIPEKYGGLAADDLQKTIDFIKEKAPEVEKKYAYLKTWVEMKNIESEGSVLDGPETNL